MCSRSLSLVKVSQAVGDLYSSMCPGRMGNVGKTSFGRFHVESYPASTPLRDGGTAPTHIPIYSSYIRLPPPRIVTQMSNLVVDCFVPLPISSAHTPLLPPPISLAPARALASFTRPLIPRILHSRLRLPRHPNLIRRLPIKRHVNDLREYHPNPPGGALRTMDQRFPLQAPGSSNR